MQLQRVVANLFSNIRKYADPAKPVQVQEQLRKGHICVRLSNAVNPVAGAVESTWAAASGQIKTVVNNVVFPAIDMILAIFFFVKLGTEYFDYRKTGQFEWTAPAILFACLVFTLTAPLYIWDIVGV